MMALSFNSCYYQRYQLITRSDDTVFDRFGSFTAYAYTLFVRLFCYLPDKIDVNTFFYYVLVLPTVVEKESTKDIGYVVL